MRAPTVVEETHLLHAVAVGDLLDIGWSVIVIVPTAHADYAAMPRASRTLRGLDNILACKRRASLLVQTCRQPRTPVYVATVNREWK